MTKAEFASPEWWNEYKETVNSDPEMDVRGHKYFNENFYIMVDDQMFFIEIEDAEVQRVDAEPTGMDVWSFGVEGEREVWEEFIEEYPPAHKNDVFASDHRLMEPSSEYTMRKTVQRTDI